MTTTLLTKPLCVTTCGPSNILKYEYTGEYST